MNPLVIRADATSEMGIGHVMRCIALAQAWRDRGGNVMFFSYCQNHALRQRILTEGFNLVDIEGPHPDSADLKQFIRMLKDIRLDASISWIVLDGYHFEPEYQKRIRDLGIRLLVIDDYNHLPFYHADIVLNQNIGADSLQYSCCSETLLLLGLKYVLIRKEFRHGIKRRSGIPRVARKIMVTLGGADPNNVTLKVIQALKLAKIPGLDVKVVVGPVYHHLRELEAQTKMNQSSSCTFRIVQNGNMVRLMNWAEVAVSAAGSTSWELAFSEVPFLVLVLAKNQEGIGKGLEDAGIAVNCGWFHSLSTKNLSEFFEKLLLDAKLRAEYVTKMRRLVDGEGAERIIGGMSAT